VAPPPVPAALEPPLPPAVEPPPPEPSTPGAELDPQPASAQESASANPPAEMTWIAAGRAGGLGRFGVGESTALVVVLKVAILQGNPTPALNPNRSASV
jgi:hypothetical protein